MNDAGYRITGVGKGSIAEEMGVCPGDYLVKVGEREPEDIFDYQYLLSEERVDVQIRKENGEEWVLEIEKEENEDLGLTFEHELMDGYHACCNRCIFCFIDQMPPGMRETLYFKDDDSRLSFLQGNYVTLTNMTDADLDRLAYYHLSPIQVSVHTTNPALRCRMLQNKKAGDILAKMEKLKKAGITLNGQIVLCRGINDGDELERTIADLYAFVPQLQSLSIVPVGLTRFREGLYPLDPFTPRDAGKLLEQIGPWREKAYREYGMHFVHASDEWYLLAGQAIPQDMAYDGYPQLENGVGMLRLTWDEALEELDAHPREDRRREVSLATGMLASSFLWALTMELAERCPGVQATVYTIHNHFFGEAVTVAGLLTYSDLLAQLSGQELGECLLLSENMLRSGEHVFLDDHTVEELSEKLGVPIRIVSQDGASLMRALLGEDEPDGGKTVNPYEPAARTEYAPCEQPGDADAGKEQALSAQQRKGERHE